MFDESPAGWLLSLGCLAAALFWMERHRTRRALALVAQRGELYRSVVDTQTDLICRYRPDTTLTFVNDAYCRFFGYQRQQLLGKSFFILLPESARAAAREYVERVLDERRMEPAEHQVMRPDGSLTWQLWWGHLITGPDGEILEVQAVGRDITLCRHRRLELERQQRELERLNRIVQLGQLAGPLTHEISQPLTSILSNIEAALRLQATQPADRASITEIMEDIAAQAHHARLLVHSVHSLLQRGRAASCPLDLNRLIVDTVSLLRPVLEECNVSVRCSLASDLPVVPADSVQMQQVFLNLISNACDAMDSIAPGQRSLTITTALADDGAVECAVRDSGIGIPTESLHRIFDSYFTTKDDGLGLGLGICRSILSAHGGSLWAVNNATDGNLSGATFLFRLQRAAN